MEKSEFIPKSQNEADVKIVGKSSENSDDDHSALTFEDFCMDPKYYH